MSNARNRILKRLLAGRPELKAEAPEISLPKPVWNEEQRIGQFRENMERVRAEVHITDAANWTDKLLSLVRDKQLKNLLHAPDGPLGSDIENVWNRHNPATQLISRSSEVDEWKEEMFFGVDAAITSTRSAIADTGTLILWPTPEEPRSYSLVPPVHFAVVKAEKLHATFAEAIDAEQWQQGMPTNALLISGPSKTADIEQTLAYGVHGPVELIILLLQ